jgi:hypothetical protein
MRTCPACGEDTKAGYAEACTKCGFSAIGEQSPDVQVTPVGEVPAPEAPEAGSQPQPAEAQKNKGNPVGRIVVWVVVIAAFFGVERLGIFGDAPGPTASEVEEAITESALQFGVKVTVDCPDDAEDTEVDATFTCTATNRRGTSVDVLVTNHEDNYEWETGPLSTLAGR